MTRARERPAQEPWWTRSLLNGLSALWREGGLTLILPNGAVRSLGEDSDVARPIWHVRRWRAFARLIARGDIGFAEGYMAGDWDTPDLTALLVAFASNYEALERIMAGSTVWRAVNAVRHALSHNSRRGARQNIMAHYDLGNDFYAAWLDPGMTYSAALFRDGTATLEQAQTAKYAALAKAADIKPGQSVLEIGCGWGGFAEYLARDLRVTVTAITLSPAQKAHAEQRMESAGLSDRVAIQLVDYRDVEGVFDRIVSVEMFEAVGEAYWTAYFDRIRELLAPGGVAALQVITIRETLFEDYRRRPDFIQLHVFPGGMLPSEAGLLDVIRQSNLAGKVVGHLGHDYAETLRRWRIAFDAGWPRIASDFDDRFRRLWRYYLSYCEAGFLTDRTDVVHATVRRTD
ncbi:MAG: class I SAM-dependent methyltransferase [Hyphomicrobium sp.]